MSSSKLYQLQILRCIAAVEVCFNHALHESLALGGSIGASPFPHGADLSFLVSGLTMIWISSNIGNSGRDALRFFLQRMGRIIPMFWLFTTLMVVATLLVPAMLGSSQFSVSHAIQSYLFIPHFNPGGNLHPILGLTWTLLYEVFFYIVFSSCLLLPARWRPWGVLAVIATAFVMARLGLFSAALNAMLGSSIVFLFVAGVFSVYVVRPLNFIRLHHLIALLVVLLTGMLVMHATGIFVQERFFSAGIPTMLVFFTVLAFVPNPNNRLNKAMIYLGDAGYILYLSHPFTLEITKQILKQVAPAAFSQYLWMVYLPLAISCSIIASIILTTYLDKPMQQAIKRLLKKV